MKEKNLQIQLNIKGFHPYYLNRIVLLALNKIKKWNMKTFVIEKQIFIPKKRKRFTLLRSPHVDKKARDQFERVTYKRVFLLKVALTDKTILHLYRFIKYVSGINAGASIEIKYKNLNS